MVMNLDFLDFETIKDDFLVAVGFYVADLVDGVVRKFLGNIVAGFEDVATYLLLSYAYKNVNNDLLKKIVYGAKVAQFKGLLDKYVPQIGEAVAGFGRQLGA